MRIKKKEKKFHITLSMVLSITLSFFVLFSQEIYAHTNGMQKAMCICPSLITKEAGLSFSIYDDL